MQAHPDARPYKTKAVLNFNDLCLIYGYTTADGRYSRSSHDLHFDDEGPLMNTGLIFHFSFDQLEADVGFMLVLNFRNQFSHIYIV